MTFPNTDGTYSQLWINDQVRIRDVQFFMDRYTDYLVDICTEPIDIIANLSFLPEEIRADYDSLWTEARMKKIINTAVQNNVAIEINTRYRIPSATFLKLAQQAGATFAIGANAQNVTHARRIDYATEMIQVLGLTAEDMFVPVKTKKIMGTSKN